ncbi:MAG: DUF362 domain-containing protein [Candidatus Abyssobacteria bacterium SURF_5]|uniref:DUF362 domain-containing protein n=1 Tax=Abyssobacteria bacterium (strain SURF_5) TaxID=2093360 RepID=A0A3A4NM65_ABYX5|nr:MAG: DUF362 domain-containing protein [Candidatus Abyssubacteria bacterium SURF_5]
MRTTRNLSLPEKLERLCSELSVFKNIKKGELVAITLHFGERGNTGFIRPLYIRRIVNLVREAGGKPFLTDANTLYRGLRSNAVDHINLAMEHGFNYASVNAPIVIADGLRGKDYVEVEINGKYFKKVKVGSAAYHADSLISAAHVKGHVLFGFGGAMKNIGMGLGARSGKQMMHADLKPEIIAKKCQGCGLCVKWCPTDSLSLERRPERDKALSVLNAASCIGCGECVVTCQHEAIKISWSGGPQSVQEKTVEFAWAIAKDKKDKIGAINFLMDISPDCDCLGRSDASIVPDIGIVASDDIVAADRASIDLINRQPSLCNTIIPEDKLGVADKFGLIHGVEWHHQFTYAEQIGLGETTYETRSV